MTYPTDGKICLVALDLPRGPDSVPPTFRLPENRNLIGILFHEVDGLSGNAALTVVLTDFLGGEGGVSPANG